MAERDILIPVILSGGTGSRLWPISREAHPKPFVKLPDGQSLLQKTFQRALSLPHVTEIITITNKEYYLKSEAEYQKTLGYQNYPPHAYLLEPCSRNTAPAIALAALKAFYHHGPNAILLVLPADHLIENLGAFTQYCQKAFVLAKANKIVTFGITPTFPETGFGYIECGEPFPSAEHCHHVKRFVEKPSAALAEEYLNSKQYLWNAGMFCFTAGMMIQELDKHAPQLLAATKKCWELSLKNVSNPSAITCDPISFSELENISIDYALMEKSHEMAVIACDLNWHDIGSWEAYKKLHPSDKDGNTILGEAILIDSTNNFIHSETKIIASIGINNLAIVDTSDALLITHRDRTQDVKQIVQTLKNNAHESYLTHRTVIRPWGSYTILEEGPGFKIKRIVVKPEASLSLQLHHHRSEHWVVVEGTAKVTKGDEELLLNFNESLFIPKETPHRLSNAGTTDLIIIEVQTGHYLQEDDIVRLEDRYGRIS